MRIEFTADISSLDVLAGGRIDRSALADVATAAEAAGIDRLLIADPTASQDVAALASYVLHATSTLNVEIQHSAGIVSPEIAARQIAALDQLSGGRVSVHIDPPGGGARARGEPRPARRIHHAIAAAMDQRRTDRFRRQLPSPRRRAVGPEAVPRWTCAHRLCRPLRHGDQGGGAPRRSVRASVGKIEDTRLAIERVRAAAARHRRAEAIRFSYPIRPKIKSADVAVTAKPSMGAAHDIEAFAAWLDAQKIRRSVEAQPATAEPAEATPISGPPENIGLAILDYCAIGVTDFVVGGLRSAAEITAFGRSVVPLVRRSLIGREQRLPIGCRTACRRWRGVAIGRERGSRLVETVRPLSRAVDNGNDFDLVAHAINHDIGSP